MHSIKMDLFILRLFSFNLPNPPAFYKALSKLIPGFSRLVFLFCELRS